MKDEVTSLIGARAYAIEPLRGRHPDVLERHVVGPLGARYEPGRQEDAQREPAVARVVAVARSQVSYKLHKVPAYGSGRGRTLLNSE